MLPVIEYLEKESKFDRVKKDENKTKSIIDIHKVCFLAFHNKNFAISIGEHTMGKPAYEYKILFPPVA